MPSLLVRGGMSDVLTDEGVREFLALAPASEYVSIGSASHMVAGDRNDTFGAAVVEFLMRVRPPAGTRLPSEEAVKLVDWLHRSDLHDVP